MTSKARVKATGARVRRLNRPVTILTVLIPILILVFLIGGPTAGAKDFLVGLIGDEVRNDLLTVYTELFPPRVETADMTPMRNSGVNPFGVNVFLEQEVDEDKIRRSLEMVRDAGFGWIKQQVLWSEIEIPEKGRYYDEKNDVSNTWTKWDRIVDLAQEYGLGVIMRLDTSPQWARPGNTKIETPPDNYDDFGDFVFNVVSRYRGKVKHFIIWNEPNTTFEWGNRTVSARDYVRLLKIAYQRAKEANPDAVIIIAPLAPTREESNRAINDVVFLQQMYDAGAKQWFDVMSANPYGLRSGPFDRRLDMDRDVNFSRPMLIREVMVRNGDAEKPIWASEMGWNALPPDFPQEPIFGRVTREQQADYTVEGYRRILEEWPWMPMANLWHLRRVHPVNETEQMYYFGIIGYDFVPTPAYYAIKQMTQDDRVAYRGYHQETHWALSYEGGWRDQKDERASLGAYKVAALPGSTIRFDFKGTDLSLVLARGEGMGWLRVEIDGSPSPANRLPKDSSGAAYVDLWAESPSWQEAIPVAGGLDDARHSVRIVTELKGNTQTASWNIDGFIVDSRTFRWPPAILGVAVAIVGFSVGVLAAVVGASVLASGEYGGTPKRGEG
ncbi:MAG: cellulase family glycosylhydrolase [Chloroflexi bacterium]|nr:cellulase family glycosylhydrolase [Chloroflexota bacterium]